MPAVKEHTARFRKNLKQFIQLKEAGKLNGSATDIKDKLKNSAGIIGLDFLKEYKKAYRQTSNVKGETVLEARKNPSLPTIKVDTSLLEGDSIKELQKSAAEYAKANYLPSTIINEDQEIEVILRWRGVKRAIHKRSPKIRLYTIPHIPELIKRGLLTSIETDRKNRSDIKRVLKFEALADIDGKLYSVWIVVRETSSGRLYYEHTIVEKQDQKNRPAGTSGRASQKGKLPDRPSASHSKDTDFPDKRENPVKTPFTVTLKELDKLHTIRSIKKLNSYVGHKHPCYIATHSGEKANSHIAFKYDPDYRQKKYTLDLLLDGQIEYTACAEGADKSFTSAWKEIVDKYGNLEIEIRSQDHAKKVLGAAEYRRREKKQEKSDTVTSVSEDGLKQKVLREFKKMGIRVTGVNESFPELAITGIDYVNDLGLELGYKKAYEMWSNDNAVKPVAKVVQKLSNYSEAKSEKPKGKKENDNRRLGRKLATILIAGNPTTVDFKADGSIKEDGYYSIMEADFIEPSHNKDCTQNSEHEISRSQPRDRSKEALCAQPKFIAQNLNPASITKGNLAFSGAPVVMEIGQVIQGNGRSIALKIAYDEYPKSAKRYKEYLIAHAKDYGIKPKAIKTYDEPVLVRILRVSKERAIELGNVVDTSQAKMSKVDQAKAYIRNLSKQKKQVIGNFINDSAGETLGEVLDDVGLRIMDQFKELDRAELVEKNGLTSEGKDFLRSVFAGLVFDSDENKNALRYFLDLKHTQKAGLERSYGNIIPFIGTKADITPEIQKAVEIVAKVQKTDGLNTVDDFINQTDAFGENNWRRFTKYPAQLAEFLLNAGTQKEIRDAFRMYQWKVNGKEDLFNPIEKVSPNEAFKAAFVDRVRINPAPDIHSLIVRAQRLQNLGNDNAKELKQLTELLKTQGKAWRWNEGKTKIIVNDIRENRKPPQKRKARFISLGICQKILIDQGKDEPVTLEGPHALLTNKQKNKIYVVPFNLIKELPKGIRDKKAEEIFKEWHNYAPDDQDFSIQWPDDAKSYPVGTAHSIYYVSDKIMREWDRKGKLNIYHHEFDSGKRPAAKKGNILIVGNLKINGAGILN